jgi:hypothetical protein
MNGIYVQVTYLQLVNPVIFHNYGHDLKRFVSPPASGERESETSGPMEGAEGRLGDERTAEGGAHSRRGGFTLVG